MLRRGTLLVALSSSGCATMPDHPVQRALYADTRQIVETQERIGWRIDRYEIEDIAPSMLQSVCRVEEEHRLELLDWLDRRIEAEGGPSELAYERAGGDVDEVDDEIFTLERMRDSLTYADEHAAEECPFYLEPDPEFDGFQTDTHRVVLLAESMGGLALIYQDRILFGGGGALRLLPAYGITDRFTLAMGLELGGSGGVSGVGGDEEQELVARPTAAIPLVLRIHDDTWLYDIEVAGLTLYHDSAVAWPPGVRGAFGLGIGSIRIGSIMPTVMGFVGYEYFPSFRDLPRAHSLRVGTRLGVNFDP